MKTISAIAVAVLLSACGPDKMVKTCESDENLVGLMGGDSQQLECDRLIRNVRNAKADLMRKYTNEDGSTYQAIKSEREWNDKFSGVTLFVKGTIDIQNPYDPVFEDDKVSGNYNSVNAEIIVDSVEVAIAHEMFHRLDDRSGDAGKWLGSFTHQGWDSNGYQHANGDYEASYEGIVGSQFTSGNGYY